MGSKITKGAPPDDGIETGWWVRSDELSCLYRFLVDTGRLDPSDVDAVATFLAAPWERTAERKEMVAHRAGKIDAKPVPRGLRLTVVGAG